MNCGPNLYCYISDYFGVLEADNISKIVSIATKNMRLKILLILHSFVDNHDLKSLQILFFFLCHSKKCGRIINFNFCKKIYLMINSVDVSLIRIPMTCFNS